MDPALPVFLMEEALELALLISLRTKKRLQISHERLD